MLKCMLCLYKYIHSAALHKGNDHMHIARGNGKMQRIMQIHCSTDGPHLCESQGTQDVCECVWMCVDVFVCVGLFCSRFEITGDSVEIENFIYYSISFQ